MTISTDRLLDIAERLDQLRHQLCDEAEKLIPVSSPVKTADNPIVLPTVKEVRTAIIMAEHDGGWIEHTVARAVLDLIASRVPVWQPVEPGTVIKAGTRVREDWDDQITEWTLGEDEDPYASRSRSPRYWLDPRTVPAEPVDPRAELLAEELHKLVADFQANGNSRELGDPTAGAWFEAAQQVLDALNNQADR